MDYSILHSETIFEGKVFNVRIDQVEHSSGRQMRVDLIEHSGAVVLIPVDDDGKVLFVDQYRHPTGGRILELPAGTLEEDEPPQLCAARECREEVGMAPGRLTHLGSFYIAPGYSTEYLHLYLAEDLQRAPLDPDEDEDLRVVKHSKEEINARLQQGQIQDAKTLAGLMLLYRHWSAQEPA